MLPRTGKKSTMNSTASLLVIAAGMVAATPAMAQQSQSSGTPPSQEETVPLQLKAGQIMAMQQRLNAQGFPAGRADGLWGPNTSAAVTSFQEKNGLPSTGRLDQRTLQALGMISAVPAPPATTVRATDNPPAAGTSATSSTGINTSAVAAPPVAQSTAAPTINPPMTSSAASAPDRTLGTNTASTNTTGTNAAGTNAGVSNAGANAASGNSNQAVATTSVNAASPAHGANSFSRGEASVRIAHQGFQNVSNLRKDADGVWRGMAEKDGQQVQVWLDYKGNVGQQQ
jgi:peptidoglycan hydrolase-like protein with peptidoglycan-binding domain